MRFSPENIKPFPLPTSLVLFACVAVGAAAVTLLRLAERPVEWAAWLAIPAALWLVHNGRLIAHYNRLMRIVERAASREARPCAWCKRRPFFVSSANGPVVHVTGACRCGAGINCRFTCVAVAPAFQLRMIGIERALQQWNSDEYQTALHARKDARDAEAGNVEL